VMGILNSLGIFGVPAFAPMMLNLGMIFAGFFICPFFDPPIIGMAIGVILGGLGQLLFQIPTALKQGFRFRLSFDFGDPAFRKIIILMIPMAVGFSATQINVFIVTRIAASLQQGAVAYLNYAFRLMHLPLGMFALAIATVTLPEISRYAALDNRADMARAYMRSLKLGLFLVIPASALLIFGGRAIIAVLFQHGQFDYSDTLGASSALAFYSIGLMAYASVRITVPVFYAFKQTARPITASIFSVAINVFLCYMLKDSLGYKGLALAASISGFVNITILLFMLKARIPELIIRPHLKALVKILFINAVLVGFLLLWDRFLTFGLQDTGLGIRIINLLILLAGAIIIYIALAKLTRIEQLKGLQEIFRRIK